jgi:phosphoribosylaminoimidazolecarboxamide formyltransferase/IMP cyclohydrolase
MPTAILSVFDKTGLPELASGLVDLGWSLLASGGTAACLRQAGLPVTDVAAVTRSPEMLGGRVKTLHPAILGGLLARDDPADLAELSAQGWAAIDLAVVNLYPFEQTIARPQATLAEAVENIDIGGVALIRAAAKNFARTALLSDPADYPALLAELRQGPLAEDTRRRLAVKGFALTTRYDAAITAYLSGAETLTLTAYPVQRLRYGENPHQPAELYSFQPGDGPLGGRLLQGKELSYTNLLDLDAAWKAALSFDGPAVCIVKHASPCGMAVASDVAAAFTHALASDPLSAFGGVVAANRPFDLAAAAALGELFVECIAAPGFTPEARAHLASRKNCRLLDIPAATIDPPYELRSITRGLLKQQLDMGEPGGAEWKVVSQRAPSPAEWDALRFAMTACRHVKSNAIVLARAVEGGFATVGIGGGQPNRVDSARIAVQRAGRQAQGSVLASDAFFPFPDTLELAAAAGVSAVVHPGGSVRDAESLAVADAHGMAMVTSGVRHFRH